MLFMLVFLNNIETFHFRKLQKLQSKPKRRLLRLKLPIPIIGRPVREDQNSILDKIEYGEPSSSQA